MTSPHHDFLEALDEEGCPICRLALRSVVRWLHTLSYECVNDVPTRDRLRAARGFCPRHAWQLITEARNPFGAGIIYHDITGATCELLASSGGGGGRGLGGLLGNRGRGLPPAGRLAPQVECPACEEQRLAEERYLTVCLEQMGNQQFRARYEQSEGICLPHLRQALARNGQGERLATLVAVELEKLAALRAELAEYVRKNDYRFQYEPKGEEQLAPQRAIRKFGGLPGLG